MQWTIDHGYQPSRGATDETERGLGVRRFGIAQKSRSGNVRSEQAARIKCCLDEIKKYPTSRSFHAKKKAAHTMQESQNRPLLNRQLAEKLEASGFQTILPKEAQKAEKVNFNSIPLNYISANLIKVGNWMLAHDNRLPNPNSKDFTERDCARMLKGARENYRNLDTEKDITQAKSLLDLIDKIAVKPPNMDVSR